MKTRLPLTVISGYLGAGKTSLINRLLAEPHGLRLLVMVNDFGAINIDAALLDSATDDTLTLSNGCVCCTMGADLFLAIGDVLDRAVLPDHLIIEASGIADPARIAQVAQAEPDLIYGGIVTVVDANSYDTLSNDPLIGVQVAGQVQAADLVCLSKTTVDDPGLSLKLNIQSGAEVIDLKHVSDLSTALFGFAPAPIDDQRIAGHHTYIGWHYEGDQALTLDALTAKLDARPVGLFRFKGFVANTENSAWQVQCVGPTRSIKALKEPHQTQVVGIGLTNRISKDEVAAWWHA